MLILELFELNKVVKINCTRSMQHRTDPKTKTTQYCSLKEYIVSKENNKKHPKPPQPKSTIKTKSHKNDNHSHSKLKQHPKTNKNNQNFNSVNLATDNLTKIKICHHEVQNLKRDTKREDRSVRNSTERLYKSKSAVRICPKSSRLSPSPIISRDHPYEDKAKTHRLPTKPEKEKKLPNKSKEERLVLKKSGSMATIEMRKDQAERERGHNNRVSIKTEGSSKMNSVIRQDQKVRKIKKRTKAAGTKKDTFPEKRAQKQPALQKRQKKSKLQQKIQKSILYSQVSFQQFCQPNPSQSQLIVNDKLFVSVPGAKMKTEGWEMSIAQPRLSETSMILLQSQAAIKIQKVFRGYITRKYIEEAKFIIGKVKTIQTWWRRLLSRQKQRRGKPLSIESSLITIKDFNETMKTERLRNCSQSKENNLSNNKVNIKQLIKNILQEQHEEDDKSIVIEKTPFSIGQLQSPQNKSLTKDVYIQDKIKGQINSEKLFNSPKCMNSPNIAKTPTNNSFTIKEFFTSSNQKQKIKDMLQSPRVKSPQPPKATPQSNYGKAAQEFQIYHSQDNKIAPFETHFGAIEEFCLLLVNFFRDRGNHMSSFLERMEQVKYHRTWLTMKNWNSYKLIEETEFSMDQTLALDYEFLQSFERPAIFPSELRQQILRFPEIEIQLNSKHFDLETSTNRPIHRCFLELVFDVMEEAFYQPYKYSILQWKSQLVLQQFKDPQTFFENVFATALGHIFNWGEVMCGIILDAPQEQEQQRQAREKVMLKRLDHWDMGVGSRFGIKVEASEDIVQKLIEEMTMQMMSFSL